MHFAEKAIEDEKQRVAAYLNSESELKLLRVLEGEVLEKRESALLEKEGSGCRVLLVNDMSEDLSRMFRLFSRVPDGLAPMAEILKQHVAEVRGAAAAPAALLCCCIVCGCCCWSPCLTLSFICRPLDPRTAWERQDRATPGAGRGGRSQQQ